MFKYHFEHSLDSVERNIQHGEIIRSKKFLKNIYLDWYSYFIKEVPALKNKKMVELGSGGGFLKELVPDVITSDVIPLPGNDMTFSALEMPFEPESLGAVFMIDTMHHIPDSEKFLSEVDRTLSKDGLLVMVEPANSIWGRLIYQNFHHETFNPAGDWTIPSSGPMSDANGALPWIVFERDRALFESKFPHLKIEAIQYIKPFSYLLSGGVSRKQLAPDFMYPFIKWIDEVLPKWWEGISMFMMVKIRKV